MATAEKKNPRTFSESSMWHEEKSYQAYTRVPVHQKDYTIHGYTKSLATPLKSQMVYP